MSRPLKIFEKTAAIFLAAAMMISFGVTATAEPMEGEREGNPAVSLDEVPQVNSSSSEKTSVPLDFSGLEYQFAVANGLNEIDYTKDSWNILKDALLKATLVLDEAKDQTVIDGVEKELEEAIKGLVKMDYSELNKALGLVYAMMEENSGYIDIVNKMEDAAERARKVLIGGNQTEADSIAAELYALLEEAGNYSVGSGKEPEVVIKEVEIEVPPSDDFCNIPGHKVWPALFAISAVLNIAMAALVVYIIQKKRNTDDTVPLVQYDIDDDMDIDYIDDMDGMDDIDDADDEKDDEEI